MVSETFCSECREPCKVEKLDNSFSYAGTHCTGGRGGTHYPAGYGDPVSDCCGMDVVDEEGNILDWRDIDGF